MDAAIDTNKNSPWFITNIILPISREKETGSSRWFKVLRKSFYLDIPKEMHNIFRELPPPFHLSRSLNRKEVAPSRKRSIWALYVPHGPKARSNDIYDWPQKYSRYKNGIKSLNVFHSRGERFCSPYLSVWSISPDKMRPDPKRSMPPL